MKYLKMLGLTAVAALAVAAFAGASSASAVTLCKENVNPCPAGKRYPSGSVAHARLLTGKKAVLTTEGGLVNPTIECTNSTTSDKLTAESGNPLPDEITALTFTGCTSGSRKCTVSSKNLPYTTALTATGGGNGNMNVTDPVFAGAEIICEGLPTCIYGATSLNLKVDGRGGGSEANDPEVLAEGVTLSRQSGSGFGCPPTGHWTASYVVTEALVPGQPNIANPSGFVEAEP